MKKKVGHGLLFPFLISSLYRIVGAMSLGILFALSANFCFSLASIFFARFSRQQGVIWLNSIKCYLSFIFFLPIGCYYLISSQYQWSGSEIFYFMGSGLIGLGIGDFFLFRAFALMGPARTLVLFSFQPVVFVFLEQFLFDEQVSKKTMVSIALFICCLLTFAIEPYRQRKQKNALPSLGWQAITFALIGITLDGSGILLTKQGFAEFSSPPLAANGIRTLGAVSFYLVLNAILRRKVYPVFSTLTMTLKWQIVVASFIGTFLSLVFYLSALSLEKVSIVTAIAMTTPLWATLWERLIDKKPPSSYLWISLAFFMIAFGVFVF